MSVKLTISLMDLRACIGFALENSANLLLCFSRQPYDCFARYVRCSEQRFAYGVHPFEHFMRLTRGYELNI